MDPTDKEASAVEELAVFGVTELLAAVCAVDVNTVIPRLTKIIRFRITFISRNVISRRFL